MERFMKCPGYLNSKTLHEADEFAVEYKEWFLHDTLKPLYDRIKLFLESFHFTMANGTALALTKVADNKGLLFRFRRMPHGDTLGRLHNRIEVILIDCARLSELLNGRFKAIPNDVDCTFDVEPACGDAMPRCEGKCVSGCEFMIWGNASEFYFNSGDAMQSKVQSYTCEEGVGVSMGATDDRKKVGGGRTRFLLVLLVLCQLASGVYIYWCESKVKRLDCDNYTLKERLAEKESQVQQLSVFFKDQENFEKMKDRLFVVIRNLQNNVADLEGILAAIGKNEISRHKTDKEGGYNGGKKDEKQ